MPMARAVIVEGSGGDEDDAGFESRAARVISTPSVTSDVVGDL